MSARRLSSGLGAAALLGAVLTFPACGGAAQSATAPRATPVSPSPPAVVTVSPPSTALPVASAASPVADLTGIRYTVPPGWLASAPRPGESDLSSDAGMRITITAVPSEASPTLSPGAGSAVTVDGSPGRERGTAGASGYQLTVQVTHRGVLYSLVCAGGSAQDVKDVCDGFVLSVRWAA